MLSSFCLKSGFLNESERFWVRLLLFFIIEGQGRNPYFERVPAPERFFPRKSHRFAFKLCSKKVERFTLLLVPFDRKSSKRPGASPGRKWMSTVFHAMRNALFDFYCLASRHPTLIFFSFLDLTIMCHETQISGFLGNKKIKVTNLSKAPNFRSFLVTFHKVLIISRYYACLAQASQSLTCLSDL